MTGAADAWPVLASALGLGLFGGLHCIGMCGGLIAAFGQASASTATTPLAVIAHSAPYHLGRIASYSTAGAVAGFAGEALSTQLSLTTPLRIMAGLLVIASGAYVAGWWSGLGRLERLAAPVWRRISPLTRRFLPADTKLRRLALGAVWGWLPCGLVYSALMLSAAGGNAAVGAATMAAFGIGTLPSLWAAGAVGRLFDGAARRASVRWGAGVVLCLFGLWTISGAAWMAFSHAGGHDTHDGPGCTHSESDAGLSPSLPSSLPPATPPAAPPADPHAGHSG